MGCLIAGIKMEEDPGGSQTLGCRHWVHWSIVHARGRLPQHTAAWAVKML